MPDIFNSPALTLALAMAAGMASLALGATLRIPGILLALAAGVVLGPDVANAVRPDVLGDWLQVVVGFCVSVILFEGALSLNPRRLKRTGKPVRRLISIGALIAAGGAAAVAYFIMHWRIEIAALFGALLIVTGPTVIAPLLRRIKAEKTVATVLAAEGVLGDAVGAVLATAVFGIALHPVASSFGRAALELGEKVLAGGVVGGAAGLLIVGVGRWKSLAQQHLDRVATLALVILAFQLSNAFAEESGVLAAVIAGLVVGFLGGEKQEELIEFKEELSILFIGLLFVLLAANVRMAELSGLAGRALAVAACLVFVVRPAAVLLSTIGSGLNIRQRLFVSWIGPRGIVAAAVASLFATELAATGAHEGTEFRAVVFACIVLTVLLSGLTGRPVGRLLKVLAKTNQGWLIFGANSVARALAAALKAAGEEVLLIDRNREEVAHAEMAGLPVMQANGLEINTLLRGGVETRKGVIAVTANDEINLLFVQTAKRLAPHIQAWLALGGGKGGVTDEMVEAAGAHTMCGRKFDVALLAAMLEEDRLEVQTRKREEAEKEDGKTVIRRAGEMPLLVRRSKSVEPASGDWKGVTEVVLLSPRPRSKPEPEPEPEAGTESS
ncbi:MAG: sodium:proton antiporter [Planctomycetes bacterium]|nr:sodium:proton antiporter [Planctomycetota bacterium]